MFDTNAIRGQFPILNKTFKVFGSEEPQNLIYFDHGASTHPPARVLNKYIDFLKNYYSNVHRGHHFLSQISSEMFDNVYNVIFDFINANPDDNSIILTSNTTTALDIASGIMKDQAGITLVSTLEHHSNDLTHRRYSNVEHIAVNPDGTLDMNDLEIKLRLYKVKLVAVTGASNITGFMPEIHRIAAMVHEAGARILVDAAQLLAHKSIDVKPNDDPEHIDFLAAAGHKTYAPFGSAFLMGPKDMLDNADPYIPGGGTVIFVSEEEAFYTPSPERHQGGTPNIAGAIALAEALKFLTDVGMDNVRQHEAELTDYALDVLGKVPGIIMLGEVPSSDRLGVVSFNMEGLQHDLVATILNHEFAIAARNGCFCAHPYMHKLLKMDDVSELKRKMLNNEEVEIPGGVRMTIGIYNNQEEIDYLAYALKIISERKWKADYSNLKFTHGRSHPVDTLG